jgi:sulfonate transport system permease protein
LLGGFIIGFFRRADDLTFLVVEALRPIPSVALLPLAMLLFGFGYRMEVFVVAFATFWPFLILTQAAVKQVEPRLIEVARLMSLSAPAMAWKIVLPAAAPRLMTAFRLAIGIALVVAVTCEIASNPQGLGHALMLAQETLRPARMFAFLFWIGTLGLALNLGLLALERRLFAHRGDYDPTVSS